MKSVNFLRLERPRPLRWKLLWRPISGPYNLRKLTQRYVAPSTRVHHILLMFFFIGFMNFNCHSKDFDLKKRPGSRSHAVYTPCRKIWSDQKWWLSWILFYCEDPAISLHSYTVPLVQWSTHLLPVMRDPGSIPRGVLKWNWDSHVSVVSLPWWLRRDW